MSRTAVLLSMLLALTPATAGAAPAWHVANSYVFGGDGGWDYLNLDPASGNLFITRGSHVIVVNPATGKLLSDITGLSGVHGTAFAGGKAYITEGGANRVAVVDSATFTKLNTIATGMRPDAVLFDSATNRVFTFNAISKDATAIDTATGKVAGNVALGGKPEAAVSDGKGTIYVNIEDRSEIVAFDARTLAVKARHSLAPCEAPSGLAADLVHGRLFSGCDNKLIAVSDMKTGKVVATIPIGDGVDSNRFDPATGQVFSSNGESGTLTVAHEDTPDHYTVLQNLPTANGARTMEFDAIRHRIYVVTAERRPGNPRPVPVRGTFKLIVLAP